MWPLKVCHDLTWTLHGPGGDRWLPGPETMQEVEVTPGGLALTWTQGATRLRTELFACRTRRGLVLSFLLEAPTAAEIELSFGCDFRPMWPAGMGGQIGSRDAATEAFLLTEELGRFAVLLGGPGARIEGGAFHHALPVAPVRLRLPVAADGTPAVVVVAGAELDPGPLSEAARLGLDQAATGLARAAKVVEAARTEWRALVVDHAHEREEVRAHWHRHFARTARYSSSDAAHDEAFRWATVAVERAWVRVDGLGRGLVAGLAPSGGSERPGYGWFFDGDALIAARAMAMYGDFAGVREVLRFAASHQREDGKLMHELTLSARLCGWIENYPYAYYKGLNSSDFVVSLERYVRASGDLALARELWPTVQAALEWCATCTESSGRISVKRAGIAAVEAGPLSDSIESEVFLQGAYLGALRAAAWLAERIAQPAFVEAARTRLAQAEEGFEAFWSDAHGRYGFAMLESGGRCDDNSAYLGFPLSLGFGRPDRALATAQALNDPALTSDWGARMFATDSAIYDPAHYNTGAVFPFLTGYVAHALFAHALAPAAHQVLASQVALTGFGALGMIEEHLVGDRAEIPSRGVPHQIFSSYAIPEVTLRGVLGLDPDATAPRLDVRPCLPPDRERVALERFRVGDRVLDLTVQRTRGDGGTLWRIELVLRSGPPLTVGVAPLLPPLSSVTEGRIDGEPVDVAPLVRGSGAVQVRAPDCELTGRRCWEFAVVEGPDLCLPATLPPRGEESRHPRLVGMEVAGDELTWRIAGRAGTESKLFFHCDAGAGGRALRVEGAALDDAGALHVSFPAGPPSTFRTTEVRLRRD